MLDIALAVASLQPFPPTLTFASMTLIPVIASPGLSFMLLTPLDVLAVGRSNEAEYRVAMPFSDPKNTSISSVHLETHLRLSPSSREAMMSPLEEMFSKAAKGVFLIHPFSVANTMNSSLENFGTGRTEATTSSPLTGSTEGRGTPLAVLPDTGIWKVRSPYAIPLRVEKIRVSWSLQLKQCSTAFSLSSSAALDLVAETPVFPLVPLCCDWKSESGILLM